jgi:hypothetical protein
VTKWDLMLVAVRPTKRRIRGIVLIRPNVRLSISVSVLFE